MEVQSCTLYLCLSLTIIQAFHTIAKRSKSILKKLPPEPKPFPIIGNLLELGDKPHKSLAKLAMTNGPLMSLKLGQITTVVISSATIAKEVLQTHDQLLPNRSIPDAIRAHKQHELGLPWIPLSSRWRNIRKICNSQLFTHKMLDANQNIRLKKVQELLADDLFLAGNDTTLVTLKWAMAELLYNPEVLSKAKANLKQIIGKGNVVVESDIDRLPFLQEIVKETFRLHPPVPLLLPRKARVDVEIQGFSVPKGRDASIWKIPNSFKPERFMGSEIDVKRRNFELIPFGAGRRMCPGSPLVLRMLHLIFGSLIHTFDWKVEGDFKPKDIYFEEKFGLTLQKAKPLRAIPIMV
ncbi:hypothetical protein ACB092_10G069300 [Castanea dentata]